jgi:DNA-binding FadR family transcriptional regulator
MKEDDVAYEDVLEQHRTIFRNIKNRDPQSAHDSMRAHIIYVQNFFDSRNAILAGTPMNHLPA